MRDVRRERAGRLKAMCNRDVARHEILERHIEEPHHARFVVGRPGDSAFLAEVVVLKWGHLLVHGDVDAVIFGRCSYRLWWQVIAWMADDNDDYAEEKASIGSTCPEMARVREPEIAEQDILFHRRVRALSSVVARRALALVRDGDIHAARQMIYDETGDAEAADIGECTAHRVFMAQAVLRKLRDLLAAEGVGPFASSDQKMSEPSPDPLDLSC